MVDENGQLLIRRSSMHHNSAVPPRWVQPTSKTRARQHPAPTADTPPAPVQGQAAAAAPPRLLVMCVADRSINEEERRPTTLSLAPAVSCPPCHALPVMCGWMGGDELLCCAVCLFGLAEMAVALPTASLSLSVARLDDPSLQLHFATDRHGFLH